MKEAIVIGVILASIHVTSDALELDSRGYMESPTSFTNFEVPQFVNVDTSVPATYLQYMKYIPTSLPVRKLPNRAEIALFEDEI